MPPAAGRWRGAVYCAGAGVRILASLLGAGLLGLPIGLVVAEPGRDAGSVGALLAAGLLLLGVGLPVIAVLLARADRHRAVALIEGIDEQLDPELVGYGEASWRGPRTLVRPLAYTVVVLTLGGALVVVALVAALGSIVAMISPFLTAAGDHAVIGPITITTVPGSIVAAVVGVGVLAVPLLVAPTLARRHAAFAIGVLISSEQRLRRDLAITARSRARLVRAFDVERRRIERDLHDGVQPRLMAVSMTLGLALTEMPPDAPGRADVVRAQEQARQTLAAVRDFVRNIHPQVLIDHGLAAAIGELADTLIIPFDLNNELTQRLPPEVETNLYFCVAELLANVVKHAGAERAEIHLHTPRPGVVEIGVGDDGRGGAGTRAGTDGGLGGIADRLAAVNGTLQIDSPPGGPTMITIRATTPDGGQR